ncbi:MAG: RusA family crossover junction endodeoxyribonuclease [Gammaproteobacteria bacterium]|nr:MAG: RusA family crossover junction endodeoxyribonuclease [Gammaproteobacteria bacterium]RLD67002.1 MAG: RusA family crossover junction endodeoxyribonuclease [Bacteroidota bacterium]
MKKLLIKLDITPVPKPRQTRADKWKKRPSVLRYRAFADEIRLNLPRDLDFNNSTIVFLLPMPKSWSKKKKGAMNHSPHTQKPDLDNLIKALLDAHLSDDSGIHSLRYVRKIWAYTGEIWIETNERLR